MENSPITIIEEHQKIKNISLDVAVYRLIDRACHDVSTGKTGIKIKIWRYVGSVSLVPQQLYGVAPKTNYEEFDQRLGRKVTRTKSLPRIYGFAALAYSLTMLGVKVTAEEVQKMVEGAINSGLRFATFVLKSDLMCIPREKFVGQNAWVLVGKLQTYEEDILKIDESMKKSGSNLRLSPIRMIPAPDQ